MRRVRGKLCRTKKGLFTRCRGTGRKSHHGGSHHRRSGKRRSRICQTACRTQKGRFTRC
jgi:hypothetical protein